MKDSQIARVIGLDKADSEHIRSRSTVRAHLRHIFSKVEMRQRAPAIARILLKHIDLQQADIIRAS